MSAQDEVATRARIAALYRSLKYDGREVTAKARQTFLDSFESPEARREYMRKLAIKSVIARGRKLRKPPEAAA